MSNYYNRQWRLPNNENKDKQSNYSMDFDGTQLVAQGVGNFTSFNGVSECSVSLWFKSSTSGQGPYKWIFNVPANTTGSHGFGIYGAGTGLTSHVYTSSLVEVTTDFSGNQWDGNWHHLVLTYKNGVGLRLYYDSVLKFTDNTMSGTITADGEELAIGGFSTGYPTGYNIIAQIDGVSAFTYALSSSQVTTLYGSSSTGIGNPMTLSPKPVFYAPLGDEDSFNGAEYLVPNSSLKDYVFDFDGTNDYINIPDSSSLRVQNLTISLWVNAGTQSNNYRYFLEKGSLSYIVYTGATTTDLLFLIYDGSGYHYSNALTNALDNNWHHIAFTYDGSQIIGYKDGIANTPVSASGTILHDTNPLRIGSRAPSLGNYPSGKMSNVQIFNTALPATGSNSVETLYNNGSPLTSMSGFTSLVGWYKLNASEVYDSSNTEWQVANQILSEKAYSFNGTNNIEITQDSSIQTSSFSIGLWVKGYPQLDKTIIENGGANGFSIKTKHDEAEKVLIKVGGTDGLTLTGALNGEWNFVWFTFDESGNLTRGGINGGYSNSGGAAVNYDSSKGLFIGSKSDSTSGFTGEIAQVVYYDGKGDNNATGTYGTVPTNPPTSSSGSASLVSWWKLDTATITDSQGSNTGTNNGATLIDTNIGRPSAIGGISSGMTQANLVQSDLSFTSGYSPYAFDFDYSSSQKINVGTVNLSSNWSISIWINYTYGFSGRQAFGGGSGLLQYTPQSSSSGGLMMYPDDTTNNYFNVTPAINDGKWHNVVFSYDNSTTTLNTYTDGYLSDSRVNTTGAALFTKIGGDFFYWDGKLSNCSVWNTNLSATQVTEIYNEGVPSNLNNHSAYSNLTNWWQLGSNSSFNTNWTVLDEKGSNNGVSSNMTEDDIVDGVNTYGGGTSSGMGGDEVVGDAPYSSANSLSVNMDVEDRVSDTPS